MISVLWSAAGTDADTVLASQVHAALGGSPATGRLCGQCGSDEHGRPWARADGRDVPVSVSRAGEHLLTVIAPDAAAVGVDVELIDREFPLDVLLAPGESAATADDAARLWVAKEAILKAQGTGLTRPLDTLVAAAFPGELRCLDAPAGCVAAIALL
ncbi:MAG TPA: 4'-phosphopantetheinyl transferase superfamily protein [Marmoricola sp.]|jgi:4'-phosphopantetheinyl transferase|nr:4'-phosphopantetheinyl transferase superfamily protein [Marmoricola sp.]